jgi:hypothetical protein
MSMQRLKNAVMEADARGLQLKLRPDGVEIIGRYGIESWRRIVGWTEIDGCGRAARSPSTWRPSRVRSWKLAPAWRG